MSFLLDKYCRSSLHLSETIRDTICKNWDKEHPGEKDGGEGDAKKPPKEHVSPSRPHNDPPAPSPADGSRNVRNSPPPPRSASNAPGASTPASAASSTGAAASGAIEAASVAPSSTDTSTAALPTLPPIGGNPFPEAQAQGQASAGTKAASKFSPTVLIVGTVCAALFAVLLIGAFVVYKRRQSQGKTDAMNKRHSGIEDGIFEVVPKGGKDTEFTFEDFATAPTGLYEREAITPPPLEQHSAVDYDEDDVMREVDAITRKAPRISILTSSTTAASAGGGGVGRMSPPLPETPWGSKDLIFASPYTPTDTGYHIADEHVYGAPVYGVPRVGVSGVGTSGVSAYTPNAAAVAAAVVSAVQGTANVVRVSGGKKNINGIPSERRHSMEWPAEFDDPEDDPLGLTESSAAAAAVDLGYGANMVDEVEEFPDVPRVDPNDPRLRG